MKISCIGELLIDFICLDKNTDLVNGVRFEKKAGGAPANVAAAISKLGGDAAFIGKVGNDPFGIFLRNTLEEVGIDTSQLLLSPDRHTTFAYVALEDDGKRDFTFNRGADEDLSLEEIDAGHIMKSGILHFGSATALLDGKLFKTYEALFDMAVNHGKFVSFDPNFRSDLWKGRETTFIQRCKEFISRAGLVKVSDEELTLITGKGLEEGVSVLHELGTPRVAVTLGEKGTLFSVNRRAEIIPSIPIKAIDTTGAGDAFIGALLYQLAAQELKAVDDLDSFKPMVSFANKVAAIVCTKYGAIASLPDLHEVEARYHMN